MEDKTFDLTYSQFYQPLLTYCKYMVSHEEAEDIIADAFFKLWKAHGIKDNKSFLYTIARNGCYDLLKHNKVKKRKLPEYADSELVLKSEMESELVDRLIKNVNELPERLKSIVRLTFYEGYKNAEVAEQMQISSQTVKNLKTMALNILKKKMNVT